MSNLKIYLPTVDGGLLPLHDEGESCKKAVHTLFTDDVGVPPRCLTIEVATESGKAVKVQIPYDVNGKANVLVDGVEI